MELGQLKGLVTLAEDLNFGRAAARLGMTQSNLSQQIKKLEDACGVVFFERSNKRVTLTREGAAYLPRVREILGGVKSLAEEMASRKMGLAGTVVLGAIPTICPYLLPKIIPELKRAAPNIKLILREETTSALLTSLKNNECDLAILALPINEPQLVSKKIGAEDFLLAVSSAHKLAKSREITMANLDNEDVLMLQEGHCFRDQALEFCHRQRREPNTVFEGSNLSSVINLAASNQGITFVPRMAAHFHQHKNIRYLDFKSPKPRRDIGVCWRLTMPLSRAQKHVLMLLEKALHPLGQV